MDAAAGDHGMSPNIEGAIAAANSCGIDVLLVGPSAEIQAQLNSRGISAKDSRFTIVDSPDLVSMSEDPAAACRAKPRASIMVCAELVAQKKAQALVSVGHSGATMVAALWHLKRLPGILRPAIAVPIPTTRGVSVLLDGGANAECKPWHLLQFGLMGSIYARWVLNAPRPIVGLLSVGAEENKGNELVKQSLPLFKNSGLNFCGPIEGGDISAGTADVIVCDGFVGNVVVKVIEGTSAAIFSLLKGEILGNLRTKVGGMLLKRAFGRLKKKMSYEEYGGAPLLGVNGIAVICHGNSSARAIASALRVAKEMVAAGLNERIRESLEDMKANMANMETARVGI